MAASPPSPPPAAAAAGVGSRSPTPLSPSPNVTNFFVWREFVWGAISGAFGEGMMHSVDTLKTRLQSQAIITGTKTQKNIFQMVRTVWTSDGLRGFYRGISPGVTGSLATGATYFGVIESTKTWLENANPNLSGHWSHFIAGGIGDTLGSFIYVPCEVMKQRMQVQGTRKSWASTATKRNISQTPGTQMYGYYNGMFHAGCSIWRDHGLKGLYAGYWSTLARDVPFAGLMIESNIVRCPDPEYAQKMIDAIDKVRVRGDSIGGVVTCLARNVPRGLGSPVFDKLEAELAKSMLSLPASKGFEIGSGFAGTDFTGSEHNDEFYMDEAGNVRTRTNRSGGVQGGISNGEIIYFKVAFKPTATIGIRAKGADKVSKDSLVNGLMDRVKLKTFVALTMDVASASPRRYFFEARAVALNASSRLCNMFTPHCLTIKGSVVM